MGSMALGLFASLLIGTIFGAIGMIPHMEIFATIGNFAKAMAGPAMGVAPYFVKDYATAARRFSAGKTFAIIGYFRDIDARLKGINNPSAKDADLWKELIYKILH
jgi:DNA polymerase-3 subunit delta